jgi:hypothetical protein
MSDSDSSDGKPRPAVGYGRPPVNRQFKPGQSGNPKGRPKRQKDVVTMFAETLNEKISVRGKNGRRRRLSKLQAMCEVMTNKALAGDAKAFSVVFQLADKHGVFKHQSSVSTNQLVEQINRKLSRFVQPPSAEPRDTLQETQNDTPAQSDPKIK